MNIIFIGDISGRTGREAVHECLYDVKAKYEADFVIANGENCSGGSGMSRAAYQELSGAGINFFTTGNHVWAKKDILTLMEQGENLVRPANFPAGAPGCGYDVVTVGGVKLGILNLMGRTFMANNVDNPFAAADELVEKMRKITPLIVVDFHAEATSEKQAMGYFLDGRVSAVLGTHTHVQTNDDVILEGGTAYISDVGMTGAARSVLGIQPEIAIYKFKTGLPMRHQIAEGKRQFNAVFLALDDETGKAEKIEKIRI